MYSEHAAATERSDPLSPWRCSCYIYGMKLFLPILFSILPLFLIVALLYYMLRKSHTQQSGQPLAGVRDTTDKSNLFFGIFWILLGIFNLFLEHKLSNDSHSLAFQHAFGAFALALGGYLIGLSVSRAGGPKRLMKK